MFSLYCSLFDIIAITGEFFSNNLMWFIGSIDNNFSWYIFKQVIKLNDKGFNLNKYIFIFPSKDINIVRPIKSGVNLR